MARAQAAKATPNVPAPASLSAADFTALLRGSGAIEDVEQRNRIKVDGATFYVGDDMYVSNPKTKEPAFYAQIVEPPREYQAAWIDEDSGLAQALGRPEAAGKMCKSHFDIPSQNREYSEDGTQCRRCPINPFARRDTLPPEANGQKCKWRGDLQLRVIDPETKQLLNGDATIWDISLPTTGMIEFKGTTKDPENGHSGEMSFMQKLVRLGAEKAIAAGEEPQKGALQALTALSLGGVLAEVRSVPMQSESGNRYHVVQFTPIDIVETSDAPALTSSESNADDVDPEVPF